MIKSTFLKKVGYKVLYALCKNGIRVKINDFSIQLPVYYFRLFPKDYEKENFAYIIKSIKQGDIILDIGAHIGLTATIFGKIVKEQGKVFSFEPTPLSFVTLKETIRINGLQNIVTPVNMPVSEKSGKVNFFVSETNVDVANSLVEYEEGKNLKAIIVDSTSIDDFVAAQKLTSVDFIKIDAEGAEYKVLLGGFHVFTKFRPKAILALHPIAIAANNDSLEQIFDQLKLMNYNIIFDGNEICKESFCEKNELFDVHLKP